MSNIQIPEWKSYPKSSNQLHTLCGYMAMFPPNVPRYFIKKYSEKGDVVFDPFCGRGTTILEAALLNRRAVGNDKNPLAVVISKAKANVPQRGRVLSRIKLLERKYNPHKIRVGNVEEKIRMIFSDSTLKQLVYLKKEMEWEKSNVDNFITAMLLGIMHGGSDGYLSLSMPNTFSMSPNYVKNYIKKHGLTKPERDVFKLLRRKLERCYERPEGKAKVYRQDARNTTRIESGSVDLIVTSPPYTRLITYGKYNWIRLWFLGREGREIDKKLFESGSIDKYCNFMTEFLREAKRVLRSDGRAVIVIGDVKKRESAEIVNLAQMVWEKCASPLGFKLDDRIYEDRINENSQGSKIWGKVKGTKIDRVLILKN